MEPILFAGGDRRTLTALAYMQRKGYPIESYALPHRTPMDPKNFSALVLPFPCLKNGRLNAPLAEHPPTLAEMIAETGIDPTTLPVIGGPLEQHPFKNYTDLSQSEELKLRNAVTTAEGALALLVENTEEAIFGMPLLILGYGAIGKRLARLLSALGARVTVAARKEKDRVAASVEGWKTQDTAHLSLQGFRAVINTVPHRLIDHNSLADSDENLCILELASPPYGMDPALAQALGKKYVLGSALPGKVAPRTAGEDLAKTLIPLLSDLKTKGSGTPVGT